MRYNNVTRVVLPVLLLGLLLSASAAQGDWAFGSDHEEMKGFVIAAVGKISAESKYDPRTFERLQWYEFRESYSRKFCFKFKSFYGSSGLDDQAALLLVDESKDVRLAIIESSVGNIKVQVEEMEPVQCPAGY
ncbi:MAG TPA: hypothetical protein VN493_30295 [Thermoanaerobaculia bacterium]|nr:hypothetical protein [Thermoanaerobaculia bacterium]